MLKDENLKVEKIDCITFPVKHGIINFLKFYFILLRSELIQLFQIRKLIKKYRPELIILDEYFFLTDYCKSWNIPVVFICDFIGVPRTHFFCNPLRFSLEAFFDWLLFAHLPRKADLWIYVGDPDHIPREEWRSRIFNENILHVEPIAKLQYTEPPSREIARKELNFKEDETVITVTVGCSGTGEYLLSAVNKAVPQFRIGYSLNTFRRLIISGCSFNRKVRTFGKPAKMIGIFASMMRLKYGHSFGFRSAASSMIIIKPDRLRWEDSKCTLCLGALTPQKSGAK